MNAPESRFIPAGERDTARPSPAEFLVDAGDDTMPGVVRSEQLLHGRPVLHIEHNGALYQLRATRLGKLILTK